MAPRLRWRRQTPRFARSDMKSGGLLGMTRGCALVCKNLALDTDSWTGPSLKRALGAWDGALITIGAVLGTAIFLTPDARRGADLRRDGRDVPARRRHVSLSEGSLRSAGGVSLRLGLLPGHHVGRHRGARGRFRRVSGRLRPLLFDAPHSRLRPDRDVE